jgi:cell wall-associated NlpC family hydrolase
LVGVLTLSVTALVRPTAAQAPLPAVLRGVQAAGSAQHAIAPAATGSALAGDAATEAQLAPGSGVTLTPSDLPRPFAAFSVTARSIGDSLVALARAQIGRRYRLGGASPEQGFDCSGLVRYVLAALHVALPRTAKEQARTGVVVARDTSQLKPGDLVTFGSTRRISHIGIYVGDGRFVQASSKAGRVIETPLFRRLLPGVKPWRGARRVVSPDSALTPDVQGLTGPDDDG